MASAYDMIGSIKVIFDVQTFASGFTKREFVLTMEDDYPQDIKLACIKEKCGVLDQVAVGDRVKVSFRIRGNLYKDRYFVDLQAFKVEKMDSDGTTVDFAEGEAVPSDEPMPF